MRVLMFKGLMRLALALRVLLMPLALLVAVVYTRLSKLGDWAELEYLLASVDQKIKARRLVQEKEEL